MPLLLDLTPKSAQLSAQGSRGFIQGGCPAVCLCLQTGVLCYAVLFFLHHRSILSCFSVVRPRLPSSGASQRRVIAPWQFNQPRVFLFVVRVVSESPHMYLQGLQM